MNNSMSSHGITPGQSVGRGGAHSLGCCSCYRIILQHFFSPARRGKKGSGGHIFFARARLFFFCQFFFFFLRLDESSTSLCSCFFALLLSRLSVGAAARRSPFLSVLLQDAETTTNVFPQIQNSKIRIRNLVTYPEMSVSISACRRRKGCSRSWV